MSGYEDLSHEEKMALALRTIRLAAQVMAADIEELNAPGESPLALMFRHIERLCAEALED